MPLIITFTFSRNNLVVDLDRKGCVKENRIPQVMLEQFLSSFPISLEVLVFLKTIIWRCFLIGEFVQLLNGTSLFESFRTAFIPQGNTILHSLPTTTSKVRD